MRARFANPPPAGCLRVVRETRRGYRPDDARETAQKTHRLPHCAIAHHCNQWLTTI